MEQFYIARVGGDSVAEGRVRCGEGV